MKKKFIFASVIIFFIGVFITSETGDNLIGTNIVDVVYHPFVWSLVFVPLSLFALVLNDQKHKTWLKFTGIFLAVSMVLVFLTPEYDSGLVGVDRELVNWFFATIYTTISIGYFIIQYFKKDKN